MRLIDAYALKGEIQLVEESIIAADSEWLKGYVTGLTAAREAVVAAPTVDAEIRVRCEKCVSSGGDAFGEMICQNQLCPCYGREVDHAFSCVLGERRADGKDT